MKRPIPGLHPFRPALETLEGRELPSGVGAFLFITTQPLAGQANTVTNDLHSLQTAQAALASDITSLKVLAIPNDYNRAGTTFNQLKGDAQNLQNSINLDMLYVTIAVAGGNLDSTDVFFGTLAINNILQAQNTNNSDKSQANNIIAMGEPLAHMSIQIKENLTPA
jgi:hypothetical protein